MSAASALRVAVVIPRYHPIFGGAENQCRMLNRALRADGRATPTFVMTKRIAPELTPRDEVDGVPVIRLGTPGTSRWNEYAFYLRAAVRLVRERASYDVIHCHATALMGAAATIAGLVGRRPVVLKLSSNGEFATGYDAPAAGEAPRRDRSLAGRLRRPFTALSARAAHIVALNREGFDELRLGRVRNAHLINNAVDTSAFRPPTAVERRQARAALGIADDTRVVLFAGRFVASKGIDTIQEALRLVRGRPGAGHLRMLLVGSAELQGTAVQPVDLDPPPGVADAPTLRVYPPTLDVRRYLWAADAFAYPSRREGMPNAVLEALAAGLPCILSDIRPHAELAERFPGCCTIFPVGDAPALAEALLAVGTPAAPARAEGPVAAEFTPAAVAARYVALYAAMTRRAHVADARPAAST